MVESYDRDGDKRARRFPTVENRDERHV